MILFCKKICVNCNKIYYYNTLSQKIQIVKMCSNFQKILHQIQQIHQKNDKITTFMKLIFLVN